ncbi:hypothetical protein [Paenibacillus sp. L3-i20]|uniref:hypothetical protein n=1 Tax=Paenibacillus sp. L3-i20 TaxID=2905833 RepID=UPI001EDED0F0|nr:hypothetical protein [Paenibacillus sp. L3-i20]
MNLANQPARSVPKPQHRRNKPTAKQRGDISVKVRRELRERSGGICERCKSHLAREAAHSVRRWKVENRTTVKELVHLCNECHLWADGCKEGRNWLIEFRNKLLEESA